MSSYLMRRLVNAVIVIFLVSIAVFAMLHLVPGDPAEILALEGGGQSADLDAIRERYGLNDPLPTQYLRFVGNALQGDLGRTIRGNRPVTDEFFSRFPNTLTLTLLALGLALIVGVPAGIASAARPNSLLDYGSMFIAVIGVSMPVFWLGLILLLFFSLQLGWFPMAGFSTWKHMVLPSVTLSMFSMASIARLTRSSFMEVMHEDYIRTARAKGLGSRRILSIHALKNSLIPVVTMSGLLFGQLLGGAVITEMVFAIPGVGRLVVDGIVARDFPVVQGTVLYLSVSFVFVNIFIDVLYTYIDPRIRYN